MIRCSISRLSASIALALAAGAASAASPQPPRSFEELMKADVIQGGSVAPASVRLTPVREAALKETAIALGTQWGIRDRSKEIAQQIKGMGDSLDRRYNFGALTMGVGFLPPVVSEARESRSVEANVLREATRVYKIDEPPRAVIIVPSWRDWLYLGLDPDLAPEMPQSPVVYPRDDNELTYWRQLLKVSYDEGRKTAQEAFDANLAQLNRTFDGMRRYYDLFKAGMVEAPVIASAQSIAALDPKDPNLMYVGDTVIRVVKNVRFVTDTQAWVPLGN